MLDWDDERPDEPGVIQAQSHCVRPGRWSAGPRGDGTWTGELLRLDDNGGEITPAVVNLGIQASERAVKSAAEQYERNHR